MFDDEAYIHVCDLLGILREDCSEEEYNIIADRFKTFSESKEVITLHDLLLYQKGINDGISFTTKSFKRALFKRM